MPRSSRLLGTLKGSIKTTSRSSRYTAKAAAAMIRSTANNLALSISRSLVRIVSAKRDTTGCCHVAISCNVTLVNMLQFPELFLQHFGIKMGDALAILFRKRGLPRPLTRIGRQALGDGDLHDGGLVLIPTGGGARIQFSQLGICLVAAHPVGGNSQERMHRRFVPQHPGRRHIHKPQYVPEFMQDHASKLRIRGLFREPRQVESG